MLDQRIEAATMEALGNRAKRRQVLVHLVETTFHALPILDDEPRHAAARHGASHQHCAIQQSPEEVAGHGASLANASGDIFTEAIGGVAMKKWVTVLGLLVLCGPVLSRELHVQRQLVARSAIHEVIQKYVWTVDSNERNFFQGPTEATYQSYWQTMHKGTDNRYTAGEFGRSEDRLVKRDGKWLIRHRKMTVFTD